MKKALALLLSLLCAALPAIPQIALPPSPTNINQSWQFVVPSATNGTSEGGSGIQFHRLTWWTASGTLTSCSVQVDGSIDGVTWVAGFVIPSQTCTSPGQALAGNPNILLQVQQVNWIRVNVTALTGGTVNVNYVGTQAEPMQLMATPSGGTGLAPIVFSNPGTPLFTIGSESGQPGLGTRNPGIEWFMATQTLTTSGNNGTMFNLVDSFMSTSCWAELESNAGTGTTPTLNVYIQDSPGDGTWNDRISFNQVTTSASRQFAGITATTSLNPTAATTGTLAAGTVINGPIAPWMRVQWVISGTTPSFTGVTIVVFCV